MNNTPSTSEIDLNKFKEKIHLVSSEEKFGISAFRMDGRRDLENMASLVDLGTPNCCDYLYINETTNKIILIEAKTLKDIYRNLKEDYKVMFKEDKLKKLSEYVKELIRLEVVAKVYGSSLILCRLKNKYENIKEKLNTKPSFILFTNISKGDSRALDNLKDSLKSGLKASLGSAKIVQEVKLFPEIKDDEELKKALDT